MWKSLSDNFLLLLQPCKYQNACVNLKSTACNCGWSENRDRRGFKEFLSNQSIHSMFAIITILCMFPVHLAHDDVIKWKHFPRNWPFVRGIHRSPVNSPHKGQWRGTLMFSLICVWINDLVNNREAGDLRRYRAHYDVIVMKIPNWYASNRGLSIDLIHKSNNAHFPYPTIQHSEQKNAHFCWSEWCIVRYETGAWWDLWDWYF